MAILSKEQILKASDMVIETVNIPEWGGEVCVKALSVSEKEQFDKKQMSSKGTYDRVNTSDYVYDLLTLSVVDKSGKQIFTREEIESLGEKNAKVIGLLYGIAAKLTFLSLEELENFKKK